jgi:mono/diheme cytochrome c family protein
MGAGEAMPPSRRKTVLIIYQDFANLISFLILKGARRVRSIGIAVAAMILLLGCSGGVSDEELAKLSPSEGGEKVFKSRCMTCHMINGLGGGVRGPNLSHVGSRMDKPTLEKFVRDPQSVKPSSRMPPLAISNREADVVAAYLSELK